MSGKKNKKLRKMMRNQAKMASRQDLDLEDHSVPADVAARLMGKLPSDLQDGVAPLQFDPSLNVTPMSAVVLDVIDPWVQAADQDVMGGPTEMSYLKFLCTMASFAWSVKLIPGEAARRDAMKDVVEFLSQHISEDEEGLAMCTDIVTTMLERAEELYPDDERAITSFEIVEEKAGPKLYVASAVPPSSLPKSVQKGLESGRLKQIPPAGTP